MIQPDAVPDCRLPGDDPKPVCLTGKVLVDFDVLFTVAIDEDDGCTDEESMLDAAREKCRSHLSAEPAFGIEEMEFWCKQGFPKRE